MSKAGRVKITVPYRHDLGSEANTKRIAGYGVSGRANKTPVQIIGETIMAEIWPGKGCKYCNEESQVSA